MKMEHAGGIVVLDFGSQFTQLIARRVRELGVYSEILRFDAPFETIKKKLPKGIILSGGPSSVYDEEAPQRNDLAELLKLSPVLGICYGMQLFSHRFGGKVKAGSTREYGRMPIMWLNGAKTQNVWMSHGDLVEELPPDSVGLAKSQSGHWAAIENTKVGLGFTGLQFHPEVSHTEGGLEVLSDFVFKKCKAIKNWQGQGVIDHLIQEIRTQVGESGRVLCALSGGVDSTVTATLLLKALGRERLQCVFVDTGLMRDQEAHEVMKAYETLKLPVKAVFAEQEFMSQLANIEDPEQKRKIIGRVFVEVFEKATKEFPCQWLAQGTLYPDVIESVNLRGQSVTIKSHHNVGGLPERMKLKLVEPLRELFKDEVRKLGRDLGVPENLLMRHPFPGPGLGIRILGAVNKDDVSILQKADRIYVDELKASGLYEKIWQAFAVLLPVRSVGVMGDGRTYDRVIALRAVTSLDGMTADWYPFDHAFLSRVSSRIVNEVKGVNRVVYDVSSKPPATIEWE
ncbi:MAG: glutamine-hydrolyzing GMP synthase [Oligoflexia bacterium]|nr:glutamine-hydrolyzing GMP synthase [Oligoflexia bacterium]